LVSQDTAYTEIYTLSLHDALPISTRSSTSRIRPVSKSRSGSGLPLELTMTFGSPSRSRRNLTGSAPARCANSSMKDWKTKPNARSEEHTSELQSLTNLVCRLLLDK